MEVQLDGTCTMHPDCIAVERKILLYIRPISFTTLVLPTNGIFHNSIYFRSVECSCQAAVSARVAPKQIMHHRPLSLSNSVRIRQGSMPVLPQPVATTDHCQLTCVDCVRWHQQHRVSYSSGRVDSRSSNLLLNPRALPDWLIRSCRGGVGMDSTCSCARASGGSLQSPVGSEPT